MSRFSSFLWTKFFIFFFYFLFQAHLEDLAEKDATEKSDAAREAFLAELALDSKKSVRGGSDNSRHTHEKTKDKRKNKEYRKSKDSKVYILQSVFVSFTAVLVNLRIKYLMIFFLGRLPVVLSSTCFILRPKSQCMYIYYSKYGCLCVSF